MTQHSPTGPVRPFIKMHGLGNHFVIVDARETAYRPDPAEIVRICDTRIGVGAEQLVVLEPTEADDADVFMRLYNVNGVEVGACGNATRCVAWMLLEESDGDEVRIETLAGLLDCRRVGDDVVSVDMGPLHEDWNLIPLAEPRPPGRIDVAGLSGGYAVNVGNPHVVFFVEDTDALDLGAIAPAIQSDPLFPDSVNVGIAQPLTDDRLRLRVYERGAGLTLACGTGACAAALAARRSGLTAAPRVTVELPGGEVQIELATRDSGAIHAVMTGPVAYVFRGEMDVL